MLSEAVLQILFIVVPTLVLVAVPVFWLEWKIKTMLKAESEGKRSPFAEKLLRPPGESLRIKIDELRTNYWDNSFDLLPILFGPALTFLILSWTGPLISSFAVLSSILICFFLALKKWQTLAEIRADLQNYRLGFDGERYVASELELLGAQGYRVFHDFIVDTRPGGEATNFNIDHIAIGPEGVFVFETKAKRKVTESIDSKLSKDQLSFNGKTIKFPDGSYTAEPIEQAKRNAKKLENWLKSSGVAGVEYRPILVYPGWCVKEGFETGVQTAKGIAKQIPKLGRGRKLSPSEVTILAARIEDKCRNVEGT